MKQLPIFGPAVAPGLQSLTASLKGLNKLFTVPLVVAINAKGVLVATVGGPLVSALPTYGAESLPGNSQKFDATASARRLLAALRDLEPSPR